jgi:hypothetical protein
MDLALGARSVRRLAGDPSHVAISFAEATRPEDFRTPSTMMAGVDATLNARNSRTSSTFTTSAETPASASV